MGSRYVTVPITGYNSSPPSDDGAQSAANQVKWSNHINKIGDPLKTALQTMNSELVTATDQSARLITSSDSAIESDHDRIIQIASTASPAVTVTLSDAATMAAGYVVTVANQSAYAATIARATGGDTIDGAASNGSVAPGAAAKFSTNSAATGYLTIGKSLVAATQADQETSTSTAVFVTPARQQFHASAKKFWVKCDTGGNVLASYNVTSITDVGTGQLTVTIATDFSSAHWELDVAVLDSTDSVNCQGSAQAAGTVTLRCGKVIDESLNDPEVWYVGGSGDQ